MMEFVRKIWRLFWSNKGKFILLLVSAVVFLFLLFPLSDLSDLVTAQVSKLTQNQVFLQFDQMNFSMSPAPGMSFQNVNLEAAGFPPVKSRELSISPALSTLITQKPAGTVNAKGFLNGDLEVNLKPGGKSDNGVERQKITLTAKKLNLNELRDVVQLPVMMKGSLDANSTALIDFKFQEQPDIDISLKIDRFELPSSNVQTQMGPLTLPELKLGSVELKGRLSAGKFLIENGVIGKDSDEVHGTIKGNLALMIQNGGGGVFANVGAYSFDIDLTVKKSFQDRANLFLSFVDAYKTPTPDGATYRFKVSSGNPQIPPNISALR